MNQYFYIIIIFSIFSMLLNYFFIKSSNYFTRKEISQIQNVHEGKVSRLGGIGVILSSIFYSIISDFDQLLFTIIISLIFIVPAIIDDLHFKINPYIRLLLILLSSFIIIINFNILPQFDFGSLNLILNNHFFQIIFFTLALACVINGQNIIDGTNGLSALTSLSIFSSITFLSHTVGDIELFYFSLFVSSLIVSFLLFNYPFGKIFLGDSGSYFLGFISGYLIIKIFSENADIPTWIAVIILFYPTLEVVFSYLRKIFSKTSPFYPDNKHLHLKIYFLLNSNNQISPKLANALVAPFLTIIWLLPLVIIPFLLKFPQYSFISMFFEIGVYIFIYYSIPNPE